MLERIREAIDVGDLILMAKNKKRYNWGSRRLKRAFFNAFILAGWTFFSTLAGMGASGILKDPKTSLLAAFISAGVAFFGRLLVEFGIKPGK